jgi:hypothetical protein
MKIAVWTIDKVILRTMKTIKTVAVVLAAAVNLVIQAEMTAVMIPQKKASSTTSSMALE